MRTIQVLTYAWTVACANCFAGEGFPRVQVIPQPHEAVSFQVEGKEILRYNYGDVMRPYFYPVIGPAGRDVTRISHPHDAFSHRHHLSLWIAHQSVDGVNIWEFPKDDKNGPRIVQDKILKIDDGDSGRLTAQGRWLDAAGKTLLKEERSWRFVPLVKGEFFLDLDLTLTPEAATSTLGKSNFGLVAVRVAKTMGVKDGGGVITDSEGRKGEPEIFGKAAKWCDYSGPAAPGVINGITLMDHPGNPNHPVHWHVREDGWMGASFTREADYVIKKEAPLKLKYRFWVHDSACDAGKTDESWKAWSETKGR